MSGLDWLMIAPYFGLLLGLTWWSVPRNRNTADDYFLSGRDLGWVVVGASLADRCGILLRRLHEATDGGRLSSGPAHGVRARRVPAGDRHAGESGNSGFQWDVIKLGVVLFLIAAAYLYFNG